MRTPSGRFCSSGRALTCASASFEAGGAFAEVEGGDVFEGNGAAAAGGNLQAAQGGEVVARFFFEDDADGDLPVGEGEAGGVGIGVADGGDAQQVADRLRGDAHSRRFVGKQFDLQLGFDERGVYLHVFDTRQALHLCFQGLRALCQ